MPKARSSLSNARHRTPEATLFFGSLSANERRSIALSRRKPVEVVARFVEHEEPEPDADFYEYLVNHEVFLEDSRRFHICVAHRRAREVSRRGWLRADFVCPLASHACPMRALADAAGGRHVSFTVSKPSRPTSRTAEAANE